MFFTYSTYHGFVKSRNCEHNESQVDQLSDMSTCILPESSAVKKKNISFTHVNKLSKEGSMRTLLHSSYSVIIPNFMSIQQRKSLLKCNKNYYVLSQQSVSTPRNTNTAMRKKKQICQHFHFLYAIPVWCFSIHLKNSTVFCMCHTLYYNQIR